MSESFGDVVRLGRLPDCEITIDPVAFPMVSGVHARIESLGRGFVLVHLSASNKTFVNDAAVSGSIPIRAGDRVRLGNTGPFIEILAIESSRHWARGPRRPHGSRPWADRPGGFSVRWRCSAARPRPNDLISARAA